MLNYLANRGILCHFLTLQRSISVHIKFYNQIIQQPIFNSIDEFDLMVNSKKIDNVFNQITGGLNNDPNQYYFTRDASISNAN
jgi:hypothetical protein